MRLALFQPDQPGNVGTLLRLAACFGVPVDIVEPCGFAFDARRLRRAAMDYGAAADVTRHRDWAAFVAATPKRMILLTTKGDLAWQDVRFGPDDVLLLGQESSGAPDYVHAAAALRVRIDLMPGARSLNVAVAAGIVLAEALRQTGGLPA